MRIKRPISNELLAVHFRMLSCRMVLVLGGLQVMTECNPGVMSRFLVIACLVMLGGLAMMLGGGSAVLLVRDARES